MHIFANPVMFVVVHKGQLLYVGHNSEVMQETALSNVSTTFSLIIISQISDYHIRT